MTKKINDYGAVIFDFDGTLYDNKKMPLRLILSLPFSIFKMKADRKVRKMLKGVDFSNGENFFSQYCKLLAAECKTSEKKIAFWYKNVYMPKMIFLLKKKYVARKNVNELFLKLKSYGIKIAVYSDYTNTEERMHSLSIDTSNVDIITSSVKEGALKPSPRPFIELANRLNVSVKKCLVVGDRDDTDGEGALKSSMDFIQINNHNQKGILWEEFLAFVNL